MASDNTSYVHYRKSTLGATLMDALSERMADETLGFTEDEAGKAMLIFDASVAEQFKNVQTKVTIAGGLHTYRLCDNVWQLITQQPTLKLECENRTTNITTDYAKIVACEARSDAATATAASPSAPSSSSSSSSQQGSDGGGAAKK